MHDVDYHRREVAIRFSLKLSHLTDQSDVEFTEELLVVVDRAPQKRKIGKSNTVLTGTFLNIFMENV